MKRCHKICAVDVTSIPDARFLQLLPIDMTTNVNYVVSILEVILLKTEKNICFNFLCPLNIKGILIALKKLIITCDK